MKTSADAAAGDMIHNLFLRRKRRINTFCFGQQSRNYKFDQSKSSSLLGSFMGLCMLSCVEDDRLRSIARERRSINDINAKHEYI